MKKHSVVIIGIGKFGSQLAESLLKSNRIDLTIIDINEEKLKKFGDLVKKVYIGDCSEEVFLEKLALENTNVFVVAVGEDIKNSMLINTTLKEKFPKSRVVAIVNESLHEDILKKIGVNEIVNPIRWTVKRTTYKVLNDFSLKSNLFNDAVEFSDNISIINIEPQKEWLNKEIQEINLIENANILLIFRNDETILARANTIIKKNDKILIMGKNKSLEKI